MNADKTIRLRDDAGRGRMARYTTNRAVGEGERSVASGWNPQTAERLFGLTAELKSRGVATFVYPLCVDKAVEIALRILLAPGFRPEKDYLLESLMVTPENAALLYERFTLPGMN